MFSAINNKSTQTISSDENGAVLILTLLTMVVLTIASMASLSSINTDMAIGKTTRRQVNCFI